MPLFLFYELIEKKDAQYNQDHKQDAENHCQVENNFFDTAPLGEDRAGVASAGNAAHTYTTILKDNQNNNGNRSYNKSNIKKCFHFVSP